MSDKMKLYWPHPEVAFNGRGISEVWLEAMSDWGFEREDNWRKADAAVFISDSQLRYEVIGQIPTLAYVWGWPPEHTFTPGFVGWARQKVELLKACTVVLSPGPTTWTQLCHYGVRSNECWPGVDTKTLDKAKKVTDRKIQVVFLSRLAPHKGLDILLNAMSLIKPKVPLLVLGPGDAEKYADLARKLDLIATFAEPTDEEKANILAESAMLVHPSLYEGFGMPPMEALYLQTPVIANDTPHMRWMLADSAYFFSSVENLAGTITHVVNNYQEASKLALVGQERVKGAYTMEQACYRMWAEIHRAHKQFWASKVKADINNKEVVKLAYEAEHRRNWAYGMAPQATGGPLRFDPTWARHWRAKAFIEELGKSVGKDVLDLGCIPPGHDVITPDGLTDIANLNKGDEVLSHDGKFHKVLEKMTRNYDGEIIEINTSMLPCRLQLTPEHPVLIKRPSKSRKLKHEGRQRRTRPFWIPASDIRQGDFVILPRLKTDTIENLSACQLSTKVALNGDRVTTLQKTLSGTKRFSVAHSIPNALPMEDFARLSGYYVSEGSQSGKSSLNFAFGPDEKEMVEKAQKSLKSLGLTSRTRNIRSSLRVTFSSAPLHRIMTENFGIGASNKRISRLFMSLNGSSMETFLQSAIDGDGYRWIDRKGNKRVSYSTVSKVLASQLVLLFERNGAVCTTRRWEKPGLNSFGSHSLPLYVTTHAVIGKRNRNFMSLEDYTARRVRSVRRLKYNGPVHNIRVENSESYVCEGVTVHNCGAVYPTILARAGFVVTGVDVSKEALAQAQQIADKWKVAVTLRQGYAQELVSMFGQNSFSSVLIGELLEHVPDPDNVLKQAIEVVKPGGIVVISTPVGRSHYDPFHIGKAGGGWDDKSMQALLAPYKVLKCDKIAEDGAQPSCYLAVVQK